MGIDEHGYPQFNFGLNSNWISIVGDQKLELFKWYNITATFNQNSGNCYDLDADIYNEEIERLYFPKGGWVDFNYSGCRESYCYAEDENGTEWEIEIYN